MSENTPDSGFMFVGADQIIALELKVLELCGESLLLPSSPRSTPALNRIYFHPCYTNRVSKSTRKQAGRQAGDRGSTFRKTRLSSMTLQSWSARRLQHLFLDPDPEIAPKLHIIQCTRPSADCTASDHLCDSCTCQLCR